MIYLAGTDHALDLKLLIGMPGLCVVCNELGQVCGMFVPHEPWNCCSLPPKAGSMRVFLYALCFAHYSRRPEMLPEIEAAIARRGMAQ